MKCTFTLQLEAIDRELIPGTLEHIARVMRNHSYYMGQKRPNAVAYNWSLKSHDYDDLTFLDGEDKKEEKE